MTYNSLLAFRGDEGRVSLPCDDAILVGVRTCPTPGQVRSNVISITFHYTDSYNLCILDAGVRMVRIKDVLCKYFTTGTTLAQNHRKLVFSQTTIQLVQLKEQRQIVDESVPRWDNIGGDVVH